MPENTAHYRAAILGYPVSHSLSPVMHGYWLKNYGIDGHYGTMAVTPDALKGALTTLLERGYAGCNLTMPHKEAALALMDVHDESCLMSGAVNTVVMRDGQLHGYNSDGFGFLESLNAQVPDWSGSRVVIVGTGGAARGIIASLRAAGAAHFVLVNRTRAKAERVVKQFQMRSVDVVDWPERAAALDGASLVVNCSSLGMTGEDPFDLDISRLPDHATVADIVYRPLETPLLAAARKRGLKTAEGLSMLMHQGRLGFEHWFGFDPAVTPELTQVLVAQMGQRTQD